MRTLSTFAVADVSDLPTPSGFIGRQRELMNIGTNLLGKKKPNTVTLHGADGIGKTALLWQSLLRFAPSFDLTLALALDPLPSLESILGRIERFLGLPSSYANETKERKTLVCERLTSKRTLLGLDNFKTLNYALNEKDSDEEKTAKSLHAFFKSLAANGVTLCITSREMTNLLGETIEDIQGLTNESGGRLFQENVVRQKGEVYIEKTQQVSEMVGGHPLADGLTTGEVYSVIKSVTFVDVPLTYWASSFIECLYNADITGGCSLSPLMYCSETNVNRAKMAVFLLRAEHGVSYTPSPATGVFADVPTTHLAVPWIEQLAVEGITGGCGADTYCPSTPVTRTQMAVFLVRTFNLP